MTVKELHKILEDMINSGLEDLEIVNANDGFCGDIIENVGETANGNFGIWWK